MVVEGAHVNTEPSTRHVNVAGVELELIASGPRAEVLRRLVADELGSLGPGAGDVAGLLVMSDDPAPPLETPTSLGSVVVAGSVVQWTLEKAGLTVRVDTADGVEPFTAHIYVAERPMPFGIPRPAFRWLERTFMTSEQAQAYVFIPQVLESLILFCCPDHTPLHAAAIEVDRSAVLLTSAGGVGKTTTATTFISSRQARFLSDDMTMVTPGRPIEPYRRRPMVYEYNVQANPALRRAVQREGGVWSPLHWHLTKGVYGAKRRRRVAPDDLYGRSVMGAASPLGLVAFLVRSDSHEVEVRDLGTRELARRSTSILATEFELLLDRLYTAEAAGHPSMVNEILERSRANYETVFAAADRCEIRIPSAGVSSIEVVRAIERRLRE